MEQATLKVFGTGQITIPKKWRDFCKTSTFKAFFNSQTKEISIKPIQIIELEESHPTTSLNFANELKEAGFNDDFIKDAVDGFKASSMCIDKK